MTNTSPYLSLSLRTLAVTTDYRALKLFGFSPYKAAEIVLDASRGDTYASAAVEIARRAVRAAQEVQS